MFYRLLDGPDPAGGFAQRDHCLADLDSPVAQWRLREDAFPGFDPVFAPVVLSADSSLVDFVDDGSAIGGQGLLLSARALAVLQGMRLPPTRAYPLQVVHGGRAVQERYFWLQVLQVDHRGWIDFTASEFALERLDDPAAAPRPVALRDAAALQRLIEKEADSLVLFTRLRLNAVYAAAPLDLFYLDRLGGLLASRPIVSQRLRDALVRAGATGCRLLALPAIVADGA